MPTLRQLKALNLIAQTGSFTRAAERLFVTQSAVSALIRELEDEVGVALVQRGRVISLTEAGVLLDRAGNRADQEINRALREIQEAREGDGETVLRVAAGSLSAATLLPTVIARLRDLEPRLKIILFDRPVGMLGDMLLSGEADVAVGSVDSPLRLSGQLQCTLLFDDRISVVCARASDLGERAARAGGLSWYDLRDAELVLVGRANGQWNLLLQDQMALHEGLRIGHEVQLLSTALELVRLDLGVAVLPAFATRQLDAASFHVAPLLQTSASWKVYFVTRSADGPTGRDRYYGMLRAQLAEAAGR